MTRTTRRTHLCRAVDCLHEIPRAMFMCSPHWHMVSAPLKREVRAAWRNYNATIAAPQASAADKAAAVDRMRKAQENAVNAVREKEIRRALRKQEHGDNLDI